MRHTRTERDAGLRGAAAEAPPRAPACSITETDWEARKAFVGFGADDVAILGELHLVARTYGDELMEELYGRWLAAPELRAFFADHATLERVKALQKRYFLDLTAGRYGYNYCRDRLRIGEVHRRIGLAPRWYLGAYAVYMQIVLPQVLAAFEYNRQKAHRAVNALVKLVALDQELALAAYFGDAPAAAETIPEPRPPAAAIPARRT